MCGTHARGLLKVLSNQTKGRLKVFSNFQTAFFIHIPIYFPTVQSVHQLSRDKPGCLWRGRRRRGRGGRGWGFGEADVAGDDGIEEQVAEVLFELFADFDNEAAAAVVHGADDAGYVEVGVDGLADFADGGHEVGDAFEGVVFAKHGDDDAVGGDQAVEGEQGQGRRAVDEDVVVVVGNDLQGVLRPDFACDFLDEFDFCAGQCAVGAQYVVAAFFAADDGVGDVGFAEDNLVNAVFDGGFVDAAACGGVTLGSRSTTRTRRPLEAREAARLTVVVVLPTPPFGWRRRGFVRSCALLSC